MDYLPVIMYVFSFNISKIRTLRTVTYPIILARQQTGFTIGQKDLYPYIPQLEPALVDFSDILIGPSHG